MKKFFLFILISIILLPLNSNASGGCCSHHSGESGRCTKEGRSICNDGTVSSSCLCENITKEQLKKIKSNDNLQDTLLMIMFLSIYFFPLIYTIFKYYKENR